MANFLIAGLFCGCCSLLLLVTIVLAIIARVIGLGRKRAKGAPVEIESDGKGPVLDAEFKDLDDQGARKGRS